MIQQFIDENFHSERIKYQMQFLEKIRALTQASGYVENFYYEWEDLMFVVDCIKTRGYFLKVETEQDKSYTASLVSINTDLISYEGNHIDLRWAITLSVQSYINEVQDIQSSDPSDQEAAQEKREESEVIV